MRKPQHNEPKQARDSVFWEKCKQMMQPRVAVLAALTLLVVGGAIYHQTYTSNQNAALERVIQEQREEIEEAELLIETETPKNVEESPTNQQTTESFIESNQINDLQSDKIESDKDKAPGLRMAVGNDCTTHKRNARTTRDHYITEENSYHQSQLSEINKLPLIGGLTNALLNETGRHLARINDIENAYLRALHSQNC